MVVRLLCIHINENIKNYQNIYQWLSVLFTKHFFRWYNCLILSNVNINVKTMLKTQHVLHHGSSVTFIYNLPLFRLEYSTKQAIKNVFFRQQSQMSQ